MKIQTKQIAFTGVMLAICIVSQFFKNASVYITGPIINACIILTVLYCGLVCGAILSVITPITAFFISGSPIMAAIPAIMPCIMLGNAILATGVFVGVKKKRDNAHLICGMVIGAVVKALFMGVVISLIIIPMLLPEKMLPKMQTFQITFSVTQLITALIGSVYAFVIDIPMKKALK